LTSPKLWIILRICTVTVLVGLLFLLFILVSGVPVLAEPAGAPFFEDTPGYPPTDEFPTDEFPTDDPYGYFTEETATQDLGTLPANITPSIVGTSTLTTTPEPNIFLTEDSEINKARTTLSVTETPAPTITVFSSPTRIKTVQQPTQMLAASKKKGGFRMDWGLFWIGFSLPVLGACGGVLYLLDRRPDLFRRSR
jgi:hypothetical protein